MRAAFFAAVAILVAAAASAQAPEPAVRLPRADVHVVVGWQNLRKEQPQEYYNHWLNAIFYGGAGAGWLWNDHLRTQVDVGAGTKASQYRTSQLTIDGNQAYESSRVWTRQNSVAISQQYQFFRNQWFHPRVAGGVEIARETSSVEFQPVYVFDNVTRISRIVRPARTEGPSHQFIARGFAETGFKAYMSRKSFFTGDMRIMFRGGVDEVLFRAGFGFDF